MSGGIEPLYSQEDITAMRSQIDEIDTQLENVQRLKRVNQGARSDVFDVVQQEEQLKKAKTQLEAIIAEFG